MLPLKNSTHFSIIILLFALITSYLGTLVFGVPMVKLLQRFNFLNLPTLVFAGTLLGILLFYVGVFSLTLLLNSKSDFNTYTIIGGAISGFIVSLTFGLMSGITSCHIRETIR